MKYKISNPSDVLHSRVSHEKLQNLQRAHQNCRCAAATARGERTGDCAASAIPTAPEETLLELFWWLLLLLNNACGVRFRGKWEEKKIKLLHSKLYGSLLKVAHHRHFCFCSKLFTAILRHFRKEFWSSQCLKINPKSLSWHWTYFLSWKGGNSMEIFWVIFKHCEGRKNTAAVALGKAFEKRMQRVCNFFYGVLHL